MKSNHVVQATRIPGRAKPIAVISDVFFVRSANSFFERVVASHLLPLDVVLAFWNPQRSDRGAPTAFISFIPYSNVTIG
jgi:hypothetical protein